MYFTRDIDGVLREWSESTGRKPLILRGARQTGKTASIRQLASRFELFLELNLERFEDLALRGLTISFILTLVCASFISVLLVKPLWLLLGLVTAAARLVGDQHVQPASQRGRS